MQKIYKGNHYDGNEEKNIPIDFSTDERFAKLFYNDECTKKEIKELNKWLRSNPNKMVRLYHGTSASHQIMEQGILPTSSSRRNSMQSRSGYVSVSVFPNMAKTFGEIAYPGREITVYAVDVPARMLVVDIDQLRNKRMWGDGDSVGTTVADSLVVGHGVQLKGIVFPYMVSVYDPER